MLGDNLSIEARLEAAEIMLRALWGYTNPIARLNVRTEVGAAATAVEARALRSGDIHSQSRAAEVRAALERMTE